MKQTSTRRPLKIAGMIIVLVFVIAVVVLSILRGYAASWTGFGDFTAPDGEFVRGKTLWDWMEVFFIPGIVAILIAFMNSRERRDEQKRAEERANLERELAANRQQDAALQSYLDRMAELLLKENLRENTEARNVARIQTLTVLRGLDARRKAAVLFFLHDAGLITQEPVVNLNGADLDYVELSRANLDGANLSGANLNEANLTHTDLNGADLSKTEMSGADLTDASLAQADLSKASLAGAALPVADLSRAVLNDTDLIEVDLSNANLTQANLTHANLYKANLTGADLSSADLSFTYLALADLTGANLGGAKVSEAQLAEAKFLKDAIMPDGTKHE